MSYHVVNPATGETAVIMDSEGPKAVEHFSMCRDLCDKFYKQNGERWDILRIEIVYSTDSDYGKTRRGEWKDSKL
jgi:hypothetical protein